MANRILVVELGASGTRAAVFTRSGDRAVITAAAEVGIRGRDNPEGAMEAILKELGNYPKHLVIVSGNVQSFTCQLNVSPSHALSMTQEQLGKAARFEVEPYVEFPLDDGLFAVDIITRKPRAGAKVTPVRVSVVYRRQYELLESVSSRLGLKLAGAYPSDMSFAFAGAPLKDPNSYELMLNLCGDESRAALANGADLLAARNLPVQGGFSAAGSGLVEVGAGSPADSIFQALHDFGGDWASPSRVILMGENSNDSLAAELSPQLGGCECVVWDTEATGGRLQSNIGDPGAAYATLAGAAVQELGLADGRTMGLNSNLTFQEKVQKGLPVAPLALVVVMFFLFFISYLFMQSSMKKLSSVHQERKKILGELNQKKTKIESQKQQIAKYNDLIEKIRTKKKFFSMIEDQAEPPFSQLLSGMSAAIPEQVAVTEIKQPEPGKFELSGIGLRPSNITAFSDGLQKAPNCLGVYIKAINELDSSRGRGSSTAAMAELKSLLPPGAMRFDFTVLWKVPNFDEK